MENRRRSTRLSGVPDQELVSLDSERKLLKALSKSNVKQQDGQQQQGQAAPAPARTNSTSSTDGGAGRSARGKQLPEQPLETFISIIETYFGPQSDAELVAAAEGVAEIWHLHDSSVRAALSDVLGPLLEKEEQLAQRAAAIKALRQERRDNFAQHGPRRTRQRAEDGQQEEAADGACANNGDNSSHSGSSKRRRSLRSNGPPSATTPPPSPLLNNNQQRQQQQQRQRMKAVTPMPGDLNGSSVDEGTRIGSGSGSDGSTVNGSDGCRSTPGVESLGQQQQQQQPEQQQQDGSASVRPTSRRKQQWRPCHAALQ